MTLKINENNITKIATFDHDLNALCIDWVARNLYWTYSESNSFDITYIPSEYYIVKFDLTMWENGIIKFDKILKTDAGYINVLPSMGYVYYRSPEKIIFH